MDFRSLETFVSVATLGGFRRAGERLHMTQPAISQRIAGLESELGTTLFERRNRAVSLTPTGRALLSYAEKLLRLRAEMLQAVGESEGMRGVLRLGVAETIVHTWLSPFIARLAKLHPRLALEIEVDTSPHLRDRLLAQEIDLALLLGPIAAPGLRQVPLSRYPVRFVASPAAGVPRRQLSVAELAAWPIITFSRNTQPYAALRELFQRPELPPVRLHASASLSTVVRLALDGLGIAVIPPAIVAGELAAKRLRLVETTASIPDLAFVASWRMGGEATAPERVAAIAAETAAAARARPERKAPRRARRR